MLMLVAATVQLPACPGLPASISAEVVMMNCNEPGFKRSPEVQGRRLDWYAMPTCSGLEPIAGGHASIR